MELEALKSLPRKKLQALAKSLGIRANAASETMATDVLTAVKSGKTPPPPDSLATNLCTPEDDDLGKHDSKKKRPSAGALSSFFDASLTPPAAEAAGQQKGKAAGEALQHLSDSLALLKLRQRALGHAPAAQDASLLQQASSTADGGAGALGNAGLTPPEGGAGQAVAAPARRRWSGIRAGPSLTGGSANTTLPTGGAAATSGTTVRVVRHGPRAATATSAAAAASAQAPSAAEKRARAAAPSAGASSAPRTGVDVKPAAATHPDAPLERLVGLDDALARTRQVLGLPQPTGTIATTATAATGTLLAPALKQPEGCAAVLVGGPAGNGKRLMLRTLAAELGARVVVLDLAEASKHEEPDDAGREVKAVLQEVVQLVRRAAAAAPPPSAQQQGQGQGQTVMLVVHDLGAIVTTPPLPGSSGGGSAGAVGDAAAAAWEPPLNPRGCFRAKAELLLGLAQIRSAAGQSHRALLSALGAPPASSSAAPSLPPRVVIAGTVHGSRGLHDRSIVASVLGQISLGDDLQLALVHVPQAGESRREALLYHVLSETEAELTGEEMQRLCSATRDMSAAEVVRTCQLAVAAAAAERLVGALPGGGTPGKRPKEAQGAAGGVVWWRHCERALAAMDVRWPPEGSTPSTPSPGDGS